MSQTLDPSSSRLGLRGLLIGALLAGSVVAQVDSKPQPKAPSTEAFKPLASEFASLRKRADIGEVAAMLELGKSLLMAGKWEGWMWLTMAAAAGDPDADFVMAVNSSERDASLRFYLSAAKRGHKEAMMALGSIYARGDGVPEDKQEAFRWFRKAADLGEESAMNDVAVMYIQGDGVPQDHQEALTWFQKAAELGNPKAMCNLGLMYSLGRGVPVSYETAYLWKNVGIALWRPSDGEKDVDAKWRESRDADAKKLTPEQLVRAQKASKELFEKLEKARAVKAPTKK